MNKKAILAFAAASMLVIAACGDDDSSMDTTTTTAAEETTTTAAEEVGNIVEVASGNDDFSTLVAAVTAAGLGDALSGDGPFTVFAPTNAAFEALPAGLLDKLLLPENKDVLTAILTYHVVEGKLTAETITAGEARLVDVTTLEGSTIAVDTNDGVKVNDATVTATDVEASNGVIHVIDAVIVPPTVDLSAL